METRLMRLIPILYALLIAASAAAQAQNVQSSGYGSPIEVADALTFIERGMKQSAGRGLKMAFAVVEPSGELVAFARMDDVSYASIQLAQQKARTSAHLRITTAEMEARVQGGRSALLSSDEVIAIGGGVPIIANGRVIGALGVSGGTAAEDDAVAVVTIASRWPSTLQEIEWQGTIRTSKIACCHWKKNGLAGSRPSFDRGSWQFLVH